MTRRRTLSGTPTQDSNTAKSSVSLGLDSKRPGRILAVLAHSPEPVLATEDDGGTWSALGSGLRAEQVVRVFAAPDGAWWVSLARGGLMRYDAEKNVWKQAGTRAVDATGARRVVPLLDIVTGMAFSSNEWYAATEGGLLASSDQGATWRLKPIGPLNTLPVQSVNVSSNGQQQKVVSLRGLVFSR